ncbi:MAG: FkbM family methyltransferase [Gammaproteobacteria bacterium]|nr:FkbM family methyltransferase [Gammaproteobacteria bacterium]
MAKLRRSLARRLLPSDTNLVSLADNYNVMRKLMQGRPVRGVLDAGASDGRVTRKLLKAFPTAQAYLFEAHPKYREALKNYAADDSRVNPQFEVLSDKCGEQALIICSDTGKTSLLPFNEQTARDSQAAGEHTSLLPVPATTIDDWRRRHDMPPIEVMKFDIQAGELIALRGATETLRASTRLIYSEVFFNPMYQNGALLGSIDLFLRDFGFVLYDLFKIKYARNGALSYGNAIFAHKELLS